MAVAAERAESGRAPSRWRFSLRSLVLLVLIVALVLSNLLTYVRLRQSLLRAELLRAQAMAERARAQATARQAVDALYTRIAEDAATPPAAGKREESPQSSEPQDRDRKDE